MIVCHVCGAQCVRLLGLGHVSDRNDDDAIELPAQSAGETAHVVCTKCWSAAMRTAENSLTDGDSRFSLAIRVVDRARDVAASMVRLAAEERTRL